MEGSSSFHKLWVIESLPNGDLKTGRNLVDGPLVAAQAKHPHLQMIYQKPFSKSELFGVLGVIRAETAMQGIYPMIHLDCHGCPDGLGTADGDLVAWDELRSVLIGINHACRLNLVIVLAACNGAHLINVAKKPDRAPFWAIIAPDKEVTAGAVEKDFAAFYEEFFESLDGDAAIAKLNRGITDSTRRYHFLSAAGLFARAYREYYRKHCVGQGKRQRIEELVTQALQNPAVRQLGVRDVRRRVKEGLSDDKQHFTDLKARYFFLDLFPENAARFSFSMQDVLNADEPLRTD
jgi:hypothetical protein